MKISQKSDIAGYIGELTSALKAHHECCVKPSGKETFVIIPKLNIIANKNISSALLWELISEYRHQPTYIKKQLAYIYTLAMLMFVKINLPVLKRTQFDFDDQYPAILGGNNRIRLISACNKYALILAVNDVTKWSCNAVIKASNYYADCGVISLPNVMSLPCGGYLEEQIKGIALNRLSKRENKKFNMNIIRHINQFFDFQNERSFKMNIEEFFEYKHAYLTEKMTDENLVSESEIEFVSHLKEKIKSVTNIRDIKCVWAHGDLNTGNIFISEAGKVYLIDWEYFGVRSVNYDEFVYRKNLRHTQSYAEYNNILTSAEVSLLNVIEEYFFSLVNGKKNIELDDAKLKFCRRALIARLG